MKTANLIKTQSGASDVTSAAFQLGDFQSCSISVIFSGSDLAGSVSLEGSNDETGASNFITITGSTTAVTASGDVMFNVSSAEYRWIRVAWDYTSGTGNITADILVKSPVQKAVSN